MKKPFLYVGVLALALLVVTGCGAKDTDTPDMTDTTAPAAAEDTMTDTRPADGVTSEDGMMESYTHVLNLEESTLGWAGTKVVGGGHNGVVEITEGGIVVNEDENIVNGMFVIDMNTIRATDIDSPSLDGHLKNEDFFDVAQYPTAKFEIESVDFTGNATADVMGALTIKDVTQEIEFPATITQNDAGNFIAQAEFSIDRTEWNVKYGSDKFFEGLKDNVIADEMTFTLELVAMPVQK